MSRTGPPALALLDQIPLGICVLHRDLTVRYWNTCLEEWTAIDRRDIVARRLSDRFEHFGTPPYLPRLEAIFDGGPPTIFSSQLHPHLIPAPLPDGRLRIQHTVVTAIADLEGEGFAALVAIQDVTDLTRRLDDYRRLRDRALEEVRERRRAEEERQRLEARVQQAQKLESLGVLAGGIAHDFNNLLVGILGNAELVLTGLSPASEARRLVRAITESAKRAAELSGQMLAYAGKGRVRVVPLSLAERIPPMIPLVESSISKKAILDTDLPADLPMIEGDPGQIRQVLVNLVTNAAEALGEESGRIRISAGTVERDLPALGRSYLGDGLAAGEYVVLEVSDTGCGMDRETREKIFDPFFSTKFTGRGLGLAAVLGIVRGHRGTLEVESEPGRGTTFRVLFPRFEPGPALRTAAGSPPAAAPTARPADDPQPAADAGRGEAGTVLVVDDEEMVRRLARMALERSGFSVLTAADGRQGVEAFRAGADRVAVVLLDLTMPELSGEEVYRELRRIRPGVKVIFSSGYDQRTGPLLEDAAFLRKPYRPQDLVARVKKVLEG